jgi:hypothetical protein
MGIIARIKSWFRNRFTSNQTQPQTTPIRVESTHRSVHRDDEVSSLVWEHEHLDSERSSLKEEMTTVDSRFAGGEISVGDRDRAYRLCLARAGRISLRQMEIRQQLVQKGYEVPSDWGIVRRI